MLEENNTIYPPPRVLAARDLMQDFFQHWIENGKLAQEWNKHKADSSRAIATFLQEYSVILAETKGPKNQEWLERSITKLEHLERLQLRQHFLVGNTVWNDACQAYTIRLIDVDNATQKRKKGVVENDESAEAEAMIFMSDINGRQHTPIHITDILRKGLTNARAFLNITNLNDNAMTEVMGGQLEVQLQIFKNKIYAAYRLEKEFGSQWVRKNKAHKDAVAAYNVLLSRLGKALVATHAYDKVKDACEGIIYMAEFLWSKNYERPSIHIQQSSSSHANIIVFEPRLVQGSGNKEASWVKELAKKHLWIKKLPWQILQRPRSLLSRDGEGLKLEKVTLVSVKKAVTVANDVPCTTAAEKDEAYTVYCTPIGELGGIPVPFAMHDLTERYRITLANQKGIYLGSQTYDDKPPFIKLEEVIFAQIEVLSPILTKARFKKGITIPLVDVNLTQTLFAYKEAGIGWLQDRADANEEMRKILQRYVIYYDGDHEKCVYFDKTSADFALKQQRAIDQNYMPIHVEFHDPSIFYNRPDTFPCKTAEDLEGIQSGLDVAVERLEILKEKLSEGVVGFKSDRRSIEHIAVVQAFLKSGSLGLYRSQVIPPHVTTAARELSEKLRNGAFLFESDPENSRKLQIEILKILQASLIVKRDSFESLFTFLYRIIDTKWVGPLLIAPGNKCFKSMLMSNVRSSELLWALCCVLVSPLFVMGWGIRFFMALIARISKMPSEIHRIFQKPIDMGQDKSNRLAAAVSILFSAVGKKKLNSKSTADEALSVLLMSSAMINSAVHGELMDGKTPLMMDYNKHISEKMLVNKAIRYQQSLKTTGLQVG